MVHCRKGSCNLAQLGSQYPGRKLRLNLTSITSKFPISEYHGLLGTALVDEAPTFTPKSSNAKSLKNNLTIKSMKKKRLIMELASPEKSDKEKSKAAAEEFARLEKSLRDLEYYHGYVQREDLITMLQNPGDFLMRVSEMHENDGRLRREVILSLIPLQVEGNSEKRKSRNVVIKRPKPAMFFCEHGRTFESLPDLVTFYTKNTGACASATFQLKNPILAQPWEFKHSDVTIGKVLGEGAFGKVCMGSLKLKDGQTVDVAVKMTKVSAVLSKFKIKEMMNEARFIRNFHHRNVVRLFGVAHDEQPPYILLELVGGGSLHSHLKEAKLKGQVVTVAEKLLFCVGSARGLEYLHSNNCIHRDIAARNCLLSSKGSKDVKISDFGLSRRGPIYRMKTSCKLPVKWLAPETISTFSFSYATDVYSWGITCYEIFADGVEPFDQFTNTQTKVEILAGRFPQMPVCTPEPVKKYISGMIFVDSAHRVSMLEAAIEFERFSMMFDMGHLAGESQSIAPKTRYNILKAWKPKKK
uniref:Tyrosine-protein kinase n=2 Tax=Caenorhabditis japonica TaxID=281687 RepID=A0A8R1E0E4_CAEJA